ncbi:uncharacterized protein (TIGR02246 family) [Actinoalloteichus hoggarensis]|uniref:SnoaL-like domain-containing protein n=1 Tax=Actinoalloteichus hoggarensis TaxID=1470176 RepID=A0A221W5Q4_9PSEU|nr:SgcJ/EcaC family oxidoreductase [Actinoalloteichus hoggarensis]ASO21240.1 hypothetical protein AHOG_18075 [Actinoalloteichus hoggarensis]MBB5921171.1 uncharacterized protein (TIGR02246 family) [Actinoalloteichus hoggarensis]
MTTTPDRQQDVDALDGLLQRQVDSWARDGAAFADTFTEEADFVAVDGSHLRSRAEIAESLQEGFDGFMAGTRMSQARERTIRFPLPDVAVVVTSGVCVLRPGEQECAPEALSIQTRHAVKRDGRWLFTTFHNSRMHFSHD